MKHRRIDPVASAKHPVPFCGRNHLRLAVGFRI